MLNSVREQGVDSITSRWSDGALLNSKYYYNGNYDSLIISLVYYLSWLEITWCFILADTLKKVIKTFIKYITPSVIEPRSYRKDQCQTMWPLRIEYQSDGGE